MQPLTSKKTHWRRPRSALAASSRREDDWVRAHSQYEVMCHTGRFFPPPVPVADHPRHAARRAERSYRPAIRQPDCCPRPDPVARCATRWGARSHPAAKRLTDPIAARYRRFPAERAAGVGAGAGCPAMWPGSRAGLAGLAVPKTSRSAKTGDLPGRWLKIMVSRALRTFAAAVHPEDTPGGISLARSRPSKRREQRDSQIEDLDSSTQAALSDRSSHERKIPRLASHQHQYWGRTARLVE